MKCDPTQGGCWFCCTDDGEMNFSAEFDTFFHMDCLKKALTWSDDTQSIDLEAEIIAREFDLKCDIGKSGAKATDAMAIETLPTFGR